MRLDCVFVYVMLQVILHMAVSAGYKQTLQRTGVTVGVMTDSLLFTNCSSVIGSVMTKLTLACQMLKYKHSGI